MHLSPSLLLPFLVAAGLSVPGTLAAQPPAGSHSTRQAAQLHGLFERWDLNKDGYIDAEELAKALRGPNAKPVEHKETGKPHVDTKHPDHTFLERYDTDKDGRISRSEFEQWERAAGAELKQLADLQRRLQHNRRRGGHYRP